MDPKAFVSVLIDKLENLPSEEGNTNDNLVFERDVQTAITNLQLLHQALQQDEASSSPPSFSEQQRMFRFLPALYCAEDITDSLLIRKEVDSIPMRKREINVFEKLVHHYYYSRASSSLGCFPSSSSSRSHEMMKRFKNEIAALCSSQDHDRHGDDQAPILDIEDILGFRTEQGGGSSSLGLQQQRWARISDLSYLEEATNVAASELVRRYQMMSDVNPDSVYRDTVIVGQAGSGKTTLAKALFEECLRDPSGRRPNCRSCWVHVSGDYSGRHVLVDAMAYLDSHFSVDISASEEESKQKILQVISEYNCVIVVDDVETPQVWRTLCFILDNVSASRKKYTIIVTTSSINNLPWKPGGGTINSTDSVRVVHLNRLKDHESWKLFLKSVRSDELSFNSDTINLKEKILKVCGGLPSGIVLLGGLLSTKQKSYQEWSKVIEHLTMGNNIWAFCYQDLPSKLKPCFLYMGIFPRGFKIPVRRLILLWCAEGFITPDSGSAINPEDLAAAYFEELVVRNVIQVTKWRSDGTPKTCRMPNVLYDVFSRKAEDLGFFHQLQASDDHSHDSEKAKRQQQQQQQRFAVRRVAAHHSDFILKNFPPFLEVGTLRSYLAFDRRIPGLPAKSILAFLDNKEFGLLTVLDLEGVYKPTLPDAAIGKLWHLSYLGLRSTRIDSIPAVVATLPCLETLDVKHTELESLPSSVWEAKKLRHLYLNWTVHTGNLPSSSHHIALGNLQTLWGLKLESRTDQLCDLKNLTRVRKLGVSCDSKPLLMSVITEWVSRLTEVQELYLIGELEGDSVGLFPASLRRLTLSKSHLKDDPMPVLGKLPQLASLRLLDHSYTMSEMRCLSGGFPKLTVLKLWGLLRLKKLTVEEGAMASLRELELIKCNLSKCEGLKHVATLKKATLPVLFIKE